MSDHSALSIRQKSDNYSSPASLHSRSDSQLFFFIVETKVSAEIVSF